MSTSYVDARYHCRQTGVGWRVQYEHNGRLHTQFCNRTPFLEDGVKYLIMSVTYSEGDVDAEPHIIADVELYAFPDHE